MKSNKNHKESGLNSKSSKITKLLATAILCTGFSTIAQQFQAITNSPVVSGGGASLGAAWADLDNDGDLDLFVCNTFSQNDFLYWNEGNGGLIKATTGALVTDGKHSDGVNIADYDNDGDMDVYVVTFGEGGLLYRNMGNRVFQLQTGDPAMIASGNSFTPAAADYDNDGLLDLIVANETSQDEFLFRNTSASGGLSFVRELNSGAAGNKGFSRGASWADYDNDGDFDLFITNDGGGDFLYRNNGDGTFNRITQGDPVATNNRSYGSAWGDYDNDGDLDLLVARYQSTQLLYRNDDGVLTRVNTGAIATAQGNGQDCNWVDYDNDGHLDAFIVCQSSANLLFHNEGNGTFTQITNHPLVNKIATSTVASWGDYDQDGFMDVFISNYNNENNDLYRNLGNNNNWLAIKCVGFPSNRDGIGAKIKVTAQIGGQSVTQYREVSGGGGYQGNDSIIAHVGLGDATNVTAIEVIWPSGIVQFFEDVTSNQYLEVSEADDTVPFVFIPSSRFFTNAVNITILNSLAPSVVRYTLDGSDPEFTSSAYTGPIELTATTTIKVRAFFNGFPVSEVASATYSRVYALADGVPNTWREQYFGPGYLTDPRVPANADPDGDGFTNLQEYVGGTNPLDANSIPIYSQIRAVPLVSWNSQTNKVYKISRRDSLQSTNWVQVGDLFTATATNSSIIDLEAGPVSFYRIETVPQP